jgi:hypothetical protein
MEILTSSSQQKTAVHQFSYHANYLLVFVLVGGREINIWKR